jgi:hypothetical protein
MAQALTVLTAVARTTAFVSGDLPTYGARTLVVILDTTAIGSASITLSIKGKDPASGKYYLILAGAAAATNATRVYRVSELIAAVSNVSATDILPALIQISVAVADVNPWTATIGAVMA